MPLQILPAGTNWGATLGEGLGRGLSEGLQMLANVKMQQYQQRQQQANLAERTRGLYQAAGMPEEQATAWANAPMELQMLKLKDLFQAPQRTAFAQGLGAVAGGKNQGLEQLFGQMNPKDALALMNYQQGQRSQGFKETKEENRRLEQSASPYIERYSKLGEAARVNLPNLNTLLDLVKSGKMSSGFFGLAPSPEKKLYDATVEQILADADVTGNENLKKLGQSLQSNLGAKALETRLNAVIQRYQEGQLYHQIANDIIERNNGIPPANFEKLVEQGVRAAKKGGSVAAPFEAPVQNQQMQGVMGEQISPIQEIPPQQPGQPPMTPVQAIAAATGPNPTGEPTAEMLGMLPANALELGLGGEGINPAYLAGRAAKGAAGSITGLAGLPFNAASALTGGRIPVPGAVQTMENLPENAFNALPESINKPGSEGEKFAGDVLEDMAGILSPSGFLGLMGKGANLLGKSSPWLEKAAKFLKTTPKAAATVAGAGNAASWLSKELGANENEAGLVKMGTMLTVPVVGARFVGSKVNQLGKAVDALPHPDGKLSRNSKLFTNIGEVFTDAGKAPASPAKTEFIHTLQDVFASQPSFSDLWELKQATMKAIKNSSIRNEIKEILPEFMTSLDESLLKTSQGNPALHKAVAQYLDLANAAQTTSVVQDFVKDKILKRNHIPAVGFALHMLGLRGAAKYVPIAAGVYGLGELERLGKMAFKSPAFRQLYGRFINAAILGDVNAAENALKYLAKVMVP